MTAALDMFSPYAPPPDPFWTFGQVELIKGPDESIGLLGRIRGLASTEDEDDDGETIVQKGVDWSRFVSSGGIIVEHPAGILNLVGEPVDVTIVEGPKGTPATQVTADLYLTDRLGKACYEKGIALQKAHARRRLGFSVEGNADERDPENRKRILKSRVYNLALTTMPRNRACRVDPIMASLAASIGIPIQGATYAGGDGQSGTSAPMVPADLAGARAATRKSGRDRLLTDLTDHDLGAALALKRMADPAWVKAVSQFKDHMDRRAA